MGDAWIFRVLEGDPSVAQRVRRRAARAAKRLRG
jgi:hypothetical protein